MYIYEYLAKFAAVLGVFAIIFAVLFIALFIVYIIGKVKLFQKAGKAGWEAIIPFYSDWVFVEISGLAWWWFFIVIATTIFSIIDNDSSAFSGIAWLASMFGQFCCYYNISKKLHKDIALAILATLFSFIMVPIIGFSDSYQFDNSVPVSDMGPFGKNNEQSNSSNGNSFCPQCGNKVTREDVYCQSCGTKLK